MVMDILPGPSSSVPDQLLNVDGTLYFTADDSIHGLELWKWVVNPRLSVKRLSDQTSLISWPRSADAYILERAPSLSATLGWSTVTNVFTIQGSNYVVTVSHDSTTSFYRLRRP